MSASDMLTLRPSVPDDWHSVRRLLIDAGLPVEDLGPALLEGFLIAESEDCEAGESVIGAVGLQVFDNIGLLRSLVVTKSARKSGIGGKLLGALEAAAQVAGIGELWLLTIDADAFFARHDYEIAPRDQAPDSIRQTEEFRELCPGDAFLMFKSLLGAGARQDQMRLRSQSTSCPDSARASTLATTNRRSDKRFR